MNFDLWPLIPTQLHEPLREAVLGEPPPFPQKCPSWPQFPTGLPTPHSCPASLILSLSLWNLLAPDTSLTCLWSLLLKIFPQCPTDVLRSLAWLERPCLIYLSPSLRVPPPHPLLWFFKSQSYVSQVTPCPSMPLLLFLPLRLPLSQIDLSKVIQATFSF